MAPLSPLEISHLRMNPRVVATVHAASDFAALDSPSLVDSADLLEFRLDSLGITAGELAPRIAAAPLPAIVTARHPSEGGAGDLSPAQRRDLLGDHLDDAAAVDIELRSVAEFGGDFLREIKAAGKLLILSAHDFERTPTPGDLRAVIAAAGEAGADVVKIATHLRGSEDLTALLEVLRDSPLPCSAMGMGPLGKVSRLVLAKCGSVLNYGYLYAPNAPGQLSARRLKEMLAELSDDPSPSR